MAYPRWPQPGRFGPLMGNMPSGVFYQNQSFTGFQSPVMAPIPFPPIPFPPPLSSHVPLAPPPTLPALSIDFRSPLHVEALRTGSTAFLAHFESTHSQPTIPSENEVFERLLRLQTLLKSPQSAGAGDASRRKEIEDLFGHFTDATLPGARAALSSYHEQRKSLEQSEHVSEKEVETADLDLEPYRKAARARAAARTEQRQWRRDRSLIAQQIEENDASLKMLEDLISLRAARLAACHNADELVAAETTQAEFDARVAALRAKYEASRAELSSTHVELSRNIATINTLLLPPWPPQPRAHHQAKKKREKPTKPKSRKPTVGREGGLRMGNESTDARSDPIAPKEEKEENAPDQRFLGAHLSVETLLLTRQAWDSFIVAKPFTPMASGPLPPVAASAANPLPSRVPQGWPAPSVCPDSDSAWAQYCFTIAEH
eukprot:m.51748 g.51748  ORF g.51748 m.51748 type:complete len:431 (+) comp11731_c0_seq1:34-1326(+)